MNVFASSFTLCYIAVPLYVISKSGGGGGVQAPSAPPPVLAMSHQECKYFIQAIIGNGVDTLGLEDVADDLSCLFLLLTNLSCVTKQLLIVLFQLFNRNIKAEFSDCSLMIFR